MHKVVIAIGSNTDAATSIHHCLEVLERQLSGFQRTSIVTTAPIGMSSSSRPFLNCLVTGTSELEYEELRRRLQDIEQECGNRKSLRRKGMIVMDIDILCYDSTRHHHADWNRGYVKELLKELPFDFSFSDAKEYNHPTKIPS